MQLLQLNNHNLRNKAFPFDWYQIKLPQLIQVLESDFNHFEKVEIQKYSDNHSSFIVKNQYGKFAHEVLKETDIDNFQYKLTNRINRFKNIVNPIFVRLETFNFRSEKIYQQYWLKMISLLNEYFVNFEIILISKINPKINKIKWFHCENFDSDWKNTSYNWKDLFCK